MSIFLRMYMTLLGIGETYTSTEAPYLAPRRFRAPTVRTAVPGRTLPRAFVTNTETSLLPYLAWMRSLDLMPSFV